MDVKSVFLNGFVNEEVYVHRPPDFENTKKPNHVIKLTKALYGLKHVKFISSCYLLFFFCENCFMRTF